jgi:hypothetical protein
MNCDLCADESMLGFLTSASMYFLCQVVDEEFHVGFHRRFSVRMRNASNADYGCRVHIVHPPQAKNIEHDILSILHLLCVGWRNFFSSCTVVLV